MEYVITGNAIDFLIYLSKYITPSVPRKVAPSLGGMGLYALLFCVIDEDNKVREME